MLRDDRALDEFLVDVEVANARVIALGRRFVALQQEAAHLRGEIAKVRARQKELASLPPKSLGRSDRAVPVRAQPMMQAAGRFLESIGRWMLSRATGGKPQLKACLDLVCGLPFTNGMTLSREGRSGLVLSGWAFLPLAQASIVSLTAKAVIGGVEVAHPATRTPRDDVAGHFNRPDITLCGFSSTLPLSSLLGSSVRLQIEVLDSRGIVHKKNFGTLTLTS